MARRVYATIGRAPDNDVVLDHPTVSNHHARLSWKDAGLLVEDLSSANGTMVDGQRITAARTRPGADVRIGQVVLPWSHAGLRTLLKSGVGARTLVMPEQRSPTFVCGSCGHVGPLPAGPVATTLTCPSCRATLRTGTKPASSSGVGMWAAFGVALSMLLVIVVYFLITDEGQVDIPKAVERIAPVIEEKIAEQRIGGETAQKLAAALAPMDPLTRNTAAKLPARTQGPFHVEQVAEIWNAVRRDWRYVNDPEGREYFATSTETIQNGYIGDCDDFAITLVSMVTAIGGKGRIVLMDGPRGGHAYAEACVQGDPSKIGATLIRHYKNRFKRYITGAAPKTIAYRTTEDCPIWLNLDWNSFVPGGPYEPETWAVAVYEGGRTETLAPANPAPASPGEPTPAAHPAR